MTDRPIEDYSLPHLWKRIEQLKRYESLIKASPNGLHVHITELRKRIEALEAEVARLKDAIREHRDSFSKDMDEHDWTTEDEALWELIDEKKPLGR